ncbi:hypothetical protein CCP4SC76_3270002 [Gammaproteobacteria bacterium]
MTPMTHDPDQGNPRRPPVFNQLGINVREAKDLVGAVFEEIHVPSIRFSKLTTQSFHLN